MDTWKIGLLFILLITASASMFAIYSDFYDKNDSKESDEVFLLTRQAMGTTVSIEITSQGNNPDAAISAAFFEIGRIEGLMSTYRPESEISLLNREGRLENASPDMIYLIERSRYYSNISGGAFDITIKPILDLWKHRLNEGTRPNESEINTTLSLVNFKNITLENESVYFTHKGMAITLDGIAKGYAVDRAVEVLKDQGFKSGFINAGGDGMYFGNKPDGSTWRVGLRNPDNKSQAIAVMDISNMAVATSGNYERYFNESARQSHISDPRTGYSSEGLLSATVIAASATEADALATAVFVLGPVEGMELIENTENTECLLITLDSQIHRSSGFSVYESADD